MPARQDETLITGVAHEVPLKNPSEKQIARAAPEVLSVMQVEKLARTVPEVLPAGPYIGPWKPPWLPQPRLKLVQEDGTEAEKFVRFNDGPNHDWYRVSKIFMAAKSAEARTKGILIDSGASGAYFADHDKDLADWEAGKKPATTVSQADGTNLITGAEGNFVISAAAAKYNVKCTQLQKLSQSVLGIKPLMDAIPKCTVTFSKTKVDVKSDGVLVMTGYHESSDGLWYVDLAINTQPARVLIQRSYQQHVYLQSMADKVAFLHAMLAYLPLTSYYKAVKRGYVNVMGVEAKHIQLNPPDVKHTAKGYLRRNAHGYHSSKKVKIDILDEN